MSKTKRFIRRAFGLVEIDDDFPASPGPQEHAANVEFMAAALKDIPRPKTVFDCIDDRGKITDEGWGLLDLPNPHRGH